MIARTLLLGLLLASPTTTAPQDELSALVATEVGAAPERTLTQIWQRSVQLREAELLGEEGELDRLLDNWVARGAELEPGAVLFVAASRLQGREPDVTRLAEALQPLLEQGQAGVAGAAADLLANGAFRGLATGRREDLAKELLERAEDGDRDPATRLAFAKAAHRLGGGRERIKSNRVLRGFLDSQDSELRVLGALALAELDAVPIEGELRAVLERLARVPDERGTLASAYLEREKVREERERLLRDAAKVSDDSRLPKEIQEFLAVRRMILERHKDGAEVDRQKLVEAGIEGMLQYMDRHSSLLTSEVFDKFYGDLKAAYGGIGAYVNEDPDTGLFTVVRPIYTGPAYRAGLQTDDKIVRIDDWPTLGEETDEIIRHLKGKPGTSVDLYVWRSGMDPELIDRPTEDMKVPVVREEVTIPPGTYQMLPGGIGLLQLDTFSEVARNQAREWIPEMLGLGMKALILDLRANGGGLLTEAQAVAELFLPPKKLVVKTIGRSGRDQERTEELSTKAEPILPLDVPLIVLTGRQTASAAEIVSGALRDHKRATLVGKRTFGKGSVQQIMEVPTPDSDRWTDQDGDGLHDPWEPYEDRNGTGAFEYPPYVKLTIARYYLPGGDSIHRELDREGRLLKEGGVEPDVVIDTPLMERREIQGRLDIRPKARAHVDETYSENRDLYNRLAVNDFRRPELYPGFEDFYRSLECDLTRDEVRAELRLQARRRVQDDRGAEFPSDFVEDVQLQKAIEVALEKLGEDPKSMNDYSLVFDLPDAGGQRPLDVAALRGDVSRALELLEKARQGGESLGPDEVAELIGLLDTARKN
jgi:C-terminal peptidase prc